MSYRMPRWQPAPASRSISKCCKGAVRNRVVNRTILYLGRSPRSIIIFAELSGFQQYLLVSQSKKYCTRTRYVSNLRALSVLSRRYHSPTPSPLESGCSLGFISDPLRNPVQPRGSQDSTRDPFVQICLLHPYPGPVIDWWSHLRFENAGHRV